MIKILISCILIGSLVGCATVNTTSPRYIANDWYLVAESNDNIEVHARRAVPLTRRLGQGNKAISIPLDRWNVRLVNAGAPKCVNVLWVQMDYELAIDRGWIVMPTNSTHELGTITQRPWILSGSPYAFDDAKWKVRDIVSVSYVDGKCLID